jgi:phosphate starvation-inducible PhoH-like protein
MTSKVLELKGVDPLLVLGVNDSNLNLIEKHFPLKIFARGNKINIEGEEEQIKKVENLLGNMIMAINRKGFVTERDVKTLINVEISNKDLEREISLDTVILFTKTGAIKSRTEHQEKYYRSALENDIVFAIGPAGTGKTYLAVAIAVASLCNNEVQRIILTRPAVETGERLGFLPGDLREKIEPYLAPLNDSLHDMITPDKLKTYKEQKIIEVLPLAYMRGRTLNNAYVILDEAQNSTSLQMKMFLTRLGVNSKAIITGDVTQIDLPGRQNSGLLEVIDILKGIDGIDFIYFDERDVVRHKLVKDIIKAYNGKNDKDNS